MRSRVSSKTILITAMTISLVVTTAVVSMLLYHTANAASTAGFNAGHILDDSVLTSKDTMSVGQIQLFLNSKVSTCDTNGTAPASDFGRSDLTHAQYAATQGWPAPPYPCLKDYTQNGSTAAQLIYNAAQTYQVNPQVLIVLLQKEQGLVTDTWPLPSQYRSATGYGCPDTAACDSQYYGLTNQLNWAATMFHAIETNSPTWYTPYILGNNYIQYNPNSSCGGSVVNIQNRATQALYNYTPYQPNQAALDAGYGTVPCGAYGNRNFYLYFSDWFGNPTVPPTYLWSPVSQTVYLDAARTIPLPYNTTVAPGQKFYVTIQAKNTGNQVWYKYDTNLGTSQPRDQSSPFYNTDWLSNNRPTQMIESSVNPGDTGTFQFSLTAPQQQGAYKTYFSLVAEGITWMNDPGLYMPITVTPARNLSIYADANKTIKLNNSNLTAYVGTTLYATINVTNNSGVTLPANTTLATTNPNDHSSVFANASWIGPNRITRLDSNSPITPGQVGSFSFTLTVPTTVGSYPESFGLVVDGTGGGWIEANTAAFSVTAAARPLDQLATTQVLYAGDHIISSDGKYTFIMQADGNLVLYSPTRAVWASNTNGSGANMFIMQADGNLVLYSPTRAVWASNTNGSGANMLIMQADGNLVLYSPTRAVWASNTNGIL